MNTKKPIVEAPSDCFLVEAECEFHSGTNRPREGFMEEVSKHLEDKDNESSHLWDRRGKCGHGFTPDLGSGGVDSGDEQEGWTPSPHSLPAPCSTVGKQLGFCCDSCGATGGF